MTDPILSAAQAVLLDSFSEMRSAIAGASGEALNWRPAGGDSNTISVLAVHSLSSTRSWLSVALGAPLPERDRPSEFRASAVDDVSLLRTFDALSAECLALLDRAAPEDWAVLRKTHTRPAAGAPESVPAAWALLHALEHFREHVGHIQLTRQLWDAHGT